MTGSRLRARERQQLRAEVETVVSTLPLPYVFEVAAKRLDVASGSFEVSMRDGFLQHVIRRGRYFEAPHYRHGRALQYGDEKFVPAGLWEQPPRVARRIIDPYYRNQYWVPPDDPGPG